MEDEKKKVIGVLVVMLVSISWATNTCTASGAAVECNTVTTLLSACSTFITYGSPDPIPGSPCCDAITTINLIADTTDNRQTVCGCLMSVITTYSPNATAIATLPGFCGITLGFTIDPNTDCNYIP